LNDSWTIFRLFWSLRGAQFSFLVSNATLEELLARAGDGNKFSRAFRDCCYSASCGPGDTKHKKSRSSLFGGLSCQCVTISDITWYNTLYMLLITYIPSRSFDKAFVRILSLSLYKILSGCVLHGESDIYRSRVCAQALVILMKWTTDLKERS
jgi:hypothetical protein